MKDDKGGVEHADRGVRDERGGVDLVGMRDDRGSDMDWVDTASRDDRGGVPACLRDREESPLAANRSSSASNDAVSAERKSFSSCAPHDFGDKLPRSKLFLLMGLRSLKSPSLILEAPEITGEGTIPSLGPALSNMLSSLLLFWSVRDTRLTS